MKRNHIYELIEKERIYQDATWRVGRQNEGQYKYAAPHVILLCKLSAKLEDEWYAAKDEDFTSRFVKIAAVAIRALEEITPDV